MLWSGVPAAVCPGRRMLDESMQRTFLNEACVHAPMLSKLLAINNAKIYNPDAAVSAALKLQDRKVYSCNAFTIEQVGSRSMHT